MKTIKNLLPYEMAKEKFFEFLNKNFLYDKYFYEFMYTYNSPQCSKSIEDYWVEWTENCNPYHWIDGIIVFHEAVLSDSLWNSINKDWYNELDKLNAEYEQQN